VSDLVPGVDAAVSMLRKWTPDAAETAVFVSEDLWPIASRVGGGASILETPIPGFPRSDQALPVAVATLRGSAGRSTAVLVPRSRSPGSSEAAFALRALARWGVRRLVCLGEVGAIGADWVQGDVAVLGDHVNLLGENPLVGPHEPTSGPRFPDMTEAYDSAWTVRASAAAAALGIHTRSAVLVALPGGARVTPAESRMLAVIGGDVVGSTIVPEVITARHIGVSVFGLGLVTGVFAEGARDASGLPDVQAVVSAAQPKLTQLLERVSAEP
jgi:purine-nucleoside phosphorylase